MLLVCRHQDSDSGGWNGTRETEEGAETKTRDRNRYSRATVGLDPGAPSTSGEFKTAQVGHNSLLFISWFDNMEKICMAI